MQQYPLGVYYTHTVFLVKYPLRVSLCNTLRHTIIFLNKKPPHKTRWFKNNFLFSFYLTTEVATIFVVFILFWFNTCKFIIQNHIITIINKLNTHLNTHPLYIFFKNTKIEMLFKLCRQNLIYFFNFIFSSTF